MSKMKFSINYFSARRWHRSEYLSIKVGFKKARMELLINYDYLGHDCD